MTDPLSLLPAVIRAVSPHADAETWAGVLTAPMRSSGINTPQRIAMFVGQCAIESAYFTRLSEDFCYTTAERIFLVFGTHFASVAEADPYVGRPQALANRVYASRFGNGAQESGDGWRYRGRGLIGITFRANYEAFAAHEPRASNPDWLATPVGAAESACWFWTWPKPHALSLNAEADLWNVPGVTMRINGRLNGFPARMNACVAAARVFGVVPVPLQMAAPSVSADDLNADELGKLNPTDPS